MVITEGGRFLGVSLGFICLSVCVYICIRESERYSGSAMAVGVDVHGLLR